MLKRHLILDGLNLFHRAKGGFQKGDHVLAFNFFRGLRPIVARFLPLDRVVLVLEGHPIANHALLEGYKANRPAADPDFIRQCDEIVALLAHHPITTVRHPDHEADDVVFDECVRLAPCDDAIIVSSDSDFTQVQQRLIQHVRVWNWRTEEFVIQPPYDYVAWKALRGDPTDNVPRVPGVTEATAMDVANGITPLGEVINDAVRRDAYERNLKVISLSSLTDEERGNLEVNVGKPDWKHAEETFKSYLFRSMLKDTTFAKYKATFDAVGSAR